MSRNSLNNQRMTMGDLAKLAKVDVSTVSRALNDSPLVKPDTKAHILKIAAESGYAMNASARSLRRQSSEALGLVIPLNENSGQTISDPFFLEMVGAVSEFASKKGYDLIVSVPRSENEIAERRLLQSGKADGLIVIGQAGRAERLNALDAQVAKIVVWGGRHGETNYTLIGSDNKKGGRLAASHLFELGRKRLLYLGDTSLPEVALRFEGFLQAHKDAKFIHDPDLLLKQSFSGQTAFDAIRAFSVHHEFDGIIAASDVLAMAAIHALMSLGKSVPKDVAIVGYDNIGQAKMSTPPLTTINQNIAQGGELLVESLLRKLSGKSVKSQFTKTELIIRQSCGYNLRT